MKVYIVIVTFNRLELFKKCLKGVRNQTYQNKEIIVVNNGSTDGTSDFLENIEGIQLINQDNVGSAGGFYRGVKEAFDRGGDWIMTFDDDCEPKANYVENLLKSIKKHELESALSIKVCSGLVYEPKRDNQYYTLEVSSRNNLGNVLLKKINENLYEADHLMFPFSIISREVIEQVGYPIKDFYICYDDIEWFYRMRNKGYNFYVLPIEGGDHFVQRDYFKVNFIFFTKHLEAFSSWKTYYLRRNSMLVYRLGGKGRFSTFFRYFPGIFLSLFYKDDKLTRLKLNWKGFWDGIKMDIKQLSNL